MPINYIFVLFLFGFFACKSQDINTVEKQIENKVEEKQVQKIESLSIGLKESELDPSIPYARIEGTPTDGSAGSVLSRVIDGLGFRYHWATHQLRAEDLAYLPGNEGRSAKDVLDHLYGLSLMIKNTATKQPNIRPLEMPDVEFEELRKLTLLNFKGASDAFEGMSEIENNTIIFQRGETQSEVPFWNLLNGPMADAIYHVGQIVSFRRSSGNPMHPAVNVFRGDIQLKE